MTPIWSLVLLGVLLFLGFVVWTFKARLPKTNVPAPHNHWFLGVLPTVLKNKDRVNELFTETELKYGSFAFANPARSPAIFMGIDPRNVEHVLKQNFWNYEKPKDSKLLLQEFFGKGIFSADGEEWRIQRKTASHMFSLKELRDEMVYVFIKHAHTLIDKLSKLKPEETIDMQDMMFRYTLTSFAEVAFGYDIKGITQDEPVPFAAAFDEVQLKCTMRARNPLWRVLRLLNLGEERKLAKSVKIINSFAYERIKDGRRKVAEMKEQGREAKLNEHMDLVMRFILEAEKNGEQLTDEYLRDMVINFIIAGRDTTACLLSWTLFMLHHHPDQADRLYKENYEVLQECHGEPDYAAASKMDLCEAVLNETLRLYPSVPMDMKCALKDDVLPDGSIVPAGCRVLYSPWAHGRSAKLWDDPLTWNPDRWLGVDPPTQYAFPHFNAGPRLCLGKTLALLEAKIILSMLNNRFRFKLADGVNVKYQVNLTLPMASPLKMHVLPR